LHRIKPGLSHNIFVRIKDSNVTDQIMRTNKGITYDETEGHVTIGHGNNTLPVGLVAHLRIKPISNLHIDNDLPRHAGFKIIVNV